MQGARLGAGRHCCRGARLGYTAERQYLARRRRRTFLASKTTTWTAVRRAPLLPLPTTHAPAGRARTGRQRWIDDRRRAINSRQTARPRPGRRAVGLPGHARPSLRRHRHLPSHRHAAITLLLLPDLPPSLPRPNQRFLVPYSALCDPTFAPPGHLPRKLQSRVWLVFRVTDLS